MFCLLIYCDCCFVIDIWHLGWVESDWTIILWRNNEGKGFLSWGVIIGGLRVEGRKKLHIFESSNYGIIMLNGVYYGGIAIDGQHSDVFVAVKIEGIIS